LRVKRLVEFAQEDGTSMVVEIDEPAPEGGVVRAARPGEIAEKASQTFEAALSKIKPMAGAIFVALNDLAQCPEQIQVEFGVKITASAGAVLASAGVEGNYRVTLTWSSPGRQP
jgi:NTP-dependent ternary system trypsin peptidase co-occuring protein